MEKLGLTILLLLLGLWMLRMSRKYGLLNFLDAMIQGLLKYIVAIITILLILFALFLMGD